MPVFFIDVQHADRLERDAEGIRLAGLGEVRRYCAAGLVDAARHLLMPDMNETLVATVRNERGEVVAVHTLCVTCRLH